MIKNERPIILEPKKLEKKSLYKILDQDVLSNNVLD